MDVKQERFSHSDAWDQPRSARQPVTAINIGAKTSSNGRLKRLMGRNPTLKVQCPPSEPQHNQSSPPTARRISPPQQSIFTPGRRRNTQIRAAIQRTLYAVSWRLLVLVGLLLISWTMTIAIMLVVAQWSTSVFDRPTQTGNEHLALAAIQDVVQKYAAAETAIARDPYGFYGHLTAGTLGNHVRLLKERLDFLQLSPTQAPPSPLPERWYHNNIVHGSLCIGTFWTHSSDYLSNGGRCIMSGKIGQLPVLSWYQGHLAKVSNQDIQQPPWLGGLMSIDDATEIVKSLGSIASQVHPLTVLALAAGDLEGQQATYSLHQAALEATSRVELWVEDAATNGVHSLHARTLFKELVYAAFYGGKRWEQAKLWISREDSRLAKARRNAG